MFKEIEHVSCVSVTVLLGLTVLSGLLTLSPLLSGLNQPFVLKNHESLEQRFLSSHFMGFGSQTELQGAWLSLPKPFRHVLLVMKMSVRCYRAS